MLGITILTLLLVFEPTTSLHSNTITKNLGKSNEKAKGKQPPGPPGMEGQGGPPGMQGGAQASAQAGGAQASAQAGGAPTATNYEAKWAKLFIPGVQRPGTMCQTPLSLHFKPVKKFPIQETVESFHPRPKPNIYYNKPGFEDAAYLWDYLDFLFQAKLVAAFKKLWAQAKASPPDPKIKNPYKAQEQLMWYYNNGGERLIPFSPMQEKDETKLANGLKRFQLSLDVPIMMGGINIPQMTTIFKSLGMNFNPGLIGWQKKKVDHFDFNGDGTLSAEEFLFMVIWENKNRLDDPRLFKEIIDSVIDPLFDFLDCDSDGYITAEGMWLGLRELIRPHPEEYSIYSCVSPKTKHFVRTGSTGDIVLKNNEETEGFLNRDEWRKAVIMAYWDRQITNNNIFEDDTNTQKDMRWVNKIFDKQCAMGIPLSIR